MVEKMVVNAVKMSCHLLGNWLMLGAQDLAIRGVMTIILR